MKNRRVRYIAWGMMLIGSGLISFGKPNGWDFFWYLGAGRIMHGTANVGETYTANLEKWHNHEWLFHWIMGIVPDPGVFHLILHIVLVFSVLTGLFILTIKRSSINPLAAAFLVIIAGILMSSFLVLRAQLASYLLFIVVLGVITSNLTERIKALWIAPVMIIWANLHGAFVLGIGIIILYQLLTILLCRKNSTSIPKDLLLPVVTALIVALINPHFFEVYTYPFNWIGNTVYKENIQEWTSITRWDFLLYPYLVYTFISVLILIFARPHHTADNILYLIFAILPFSAVRHLPLYYILATPILFDSVTRIEARLTERLKDSVVLGNPKWIISLILSVLYLGINLYHKPVTRVTDPLFSKYAYPTGAVAFMRDNDLDGRILNAYQWGGYLWFEGFDIFIDGRLDTLYSLNTYLEFRKVVEATPEWYMVLENYDVNFVLFDTKINGVQPSISRAIYESDEWTVLFQDPVATLFARTDILDPGFLSHWQSGLIPVPDEPMCQYSAGMTLMERNGNREEIKKYLERAIELDPVFAQPHFRLAAVLIKEKKYNQAKYHLRIARRLGIRNDEINDLWDMASAGI